VENVIYYFYTNKDLEIPAILVINMADRMENKGTNIPSRRTFKD
jgi:hypothetical protein